LRGVIAIIIITIMVLEMKVPHGENLDALLPLLPVFCYVLSFVYVICWNNHHCYKAYPSLMYRGHSSRWHGQPTKPRSRRFCDTLVQLL
jgi:hypothetical protein